MNKIKIIPLSIKHIGILMVLITNLLVMEVCFFFMNFIEREREQLALFLGDLEVNMCAHAQSK